MTVNETNENDFQKCIRHKVHASASRLIEKQRKDKFSPRNLNTKQEEVLAKLFIN